MGISLYTSRVVLHVLGVEDFGIYNIVSGVIVLFTFVNSAMVGTTQRFLNLELGKDDKERTSCVFSISLIAHVLIAILVVLIGETVGLWFFLNYIQIPEERLSVAMWVYQFAIAGTAISILRAPYNAAIIAYEKMSAYAYISIVEAFMKLLIVYMLVVLPFDKLEIYAALMFFVVVFITLCYKYFCNRHFSITKYQWTWDLLLLKQLLSFSGWSLFGSVATVGVKQGVNIFQNMFFGVGVNAAMGIAEQVNTAVWNFSSNFQTAFKPQIVKYYAAGEHVHLESLVCRSSKISYFLLYTLSLPIIVCCNEVLSVWLKEVPLHAVCFCRLILVYSLLESFSAPLWIVIQAVGKIRSYQLVISSILILNLPLSYVALKQGYSPEVVINIQILIGFCTFIVRVLFVRHLVVFFSIRRYINNAFLPCLFITLLSVLVGIYVKFCVEEFMGTGIAIFICVIVSSLLIFFIGLNKDERTFIKNVIKRKI